MLEVKGELVFKTVAYHRAADAIAHSPLEIAAEVRRRTLPKIPGIGEAIAKKIDELVRTGRLGFHERLRAEVPPLARGAPPGPRRRQRRRTRGRGQRGCAPGVAARWSGTDHTRERARCSGGDARHSLLSAGRKATR